MTVGFDRKDATRRGYGINDENVVACIWPINRLKQSMTPAAFIDMCHKISDAWKPTLDIV